MRTSRFFLFIAFAVTAARGFGLPLFQIRSRPSKSMLRVAENRKVCFRDGSWIAGLDSSAVPSVSSPSRPITLPSLSKIGAPAIQICAFHEKGLHHETICRTKLNVPANTAAPSAVATRAVSAYTACVERDQIMHEWTSVWCTTSLLFLVVPRRTLQSCESSG